ncbi:MAG: hypothetical protein E7525_04515 [Ruminococcaceae bacterium]|nr:hypothetical protein [Oscillospiraceae bacterium]
MNSIIKEIQKLRRDKPYTIDLKNSNRYKLVVNEGDGTKTAYCFSSPVYSKKTGKLADIKFMCDTNAACYDGTDCRVLLCDSISFESPEGVCGLVLPNTVSHICESAVLYGNVEVTPTLNGLAFKVPCGVSGMYSLVVTTVQPDMSIRANDKVFSLMLSHFKPLMSLSCIGTADSTGAIVAPCVLEHKVINKRQYCVTVKSVGKDGKYMIFEANMHQPKLFQDTTVESNNPKTNNAFGTTAFIGNTDTYGEQWLYSRPELALISELFYESINSVVMHIPQLNKAEVPLSAYGVANRFCSFGSNWENKISSKGEIAEPNLSAGYYSVDVTELMTRKGTKHLDITEGLIIRPQKRDAEFATIATGDGCYAMQILEINYN